MSPSVIRGSVLATLGPDMRTKPPSPKWLQYEMNVRRIPRQRRFTRSVLGEEHGLSNGDILSSSAAPCSIPSSKGFFKCEGFDKQDSSAKSSPTQAWKGGPSISKAFLLRFLQGWDFRGTASETHSTEDRAKTPDQRSPARALRDGHHNEDFARMLPNRTVLPGLQFSLAGILGRPEVFYSVPVIRFAFDTLSYLVMLVLFSRSLLLKEHDAIPIDEKMFFIFAAGLLWREILEMYDSVPDRVRGTSCSSSEHVRGCPDANLSGSGTVRRSTRMLSAFKRYIVYETWNVLDTSTVLCILTAFIFRVIALQDEGFLFHAQLFFALSTPLLFSRLLVLSQIDDTLGPMTRVIWRMMSNTLRFSAFMALVMLSFALAFFAVFHTCSSSESSLDCSLNDAFGTFGDACVTVFASALDGPDFSVFDDVDRDCGCGLPNGARSAGIFLMVVYMISMAVVLLNLLVAVLSTTHDEVHSNAEKEHHLARTKLIYQSSRVVLRQRPPPPLNLVKLVLGVSLDTMTEVWRVCLRLRRCDGVDKLQPASKTKVGQSLDLYLQRVAFSFTMGAAAVALSAILWTISMPWVAWCLLSTVNSLSERAKEASKKACKGDQDEHDHKKEPRCSRMLSRPRRTKTNDDGDSGISSTTLNCCAKNRGGNGSSSRWRACSRSTSTCNGKALHGYRQKNENEEMRTSCTTRRSRWGQERHDEGIGSAPSSDCAQNHDEDDSVGENKQEEAVDGRCRNTLPDNERAEPESGPKTAATDQEEPYFYPGYFWRMVYLFRSFLLLLAMAACAVVLCASYIMASCVLWAVGTYEVLRSLGVDEKRCGHGDIPAPMPGQEDGDNWKFAWKIATIWHDDDDIPPHFNVGPFLKSKTGLDLHHLARRIKDKDQRATADKEPRETDRKLAAKDIYLEYLTEITEKGGGDGGKDNGDSEQSASKEKAEITEKGGGDGGKDNRDSEQSASKKKAGQGVKSLRNDARGPDIPTGDVGEPNLDSEQPASTKKAGQGDKSMPDDGPLIPADDGGDANLDSEQLAERVIELAKVLLKTRRDEKGVAGRDAGGSSGT